MNSDRLDSIVVPVEHEAGSYRPVQARTLAEWPVGTFLENLLPRANGQIWVSVHSESAIDVVEPDSGERRTLARFPSPVAGLAEAGGAVWANVGGVGIPGGAIYRVEQDGQIEPWVTLEESLFLNGLAALSPRELLSVDSIRGCIYVVDLAQRSARVWLQDERLTKGTNREAMPGVNGIKIYGDQVTVTNTDCATVVSIALTPDRSAGEVRVLAERLNGDDLAFDREGNIYVATHLGNSLLRLRPDGGREDLARNEEGMLGSTACAFARDPGRAGTLYVTTTGGILAPEPGPVQPAKLVALQVDQTGAIAWA